jgi:hypothetical protein
VVLAHLAAQQTRDDDDARFERKLHLIRRLYERGLSRQRIIDLYPFLDWILRLPEPLELRYTDAIFEIEENLKMPYVSFVERRGEARGQIHGAVLLLRDLLEQRFGPLSPEVTERLQAADLDRLRTWAERVITAGSLEEVFTDSPRSRAAEPYTHRICPEPAALRQDPQG